MADLTAQILPQLSAVQDAGGPDGFAREVLAEARTRVGRRMAKRGGDADDAPGWLRDKAAYLAVLRRLSPEFDAVVCEVTHAILAGRPIVPADAVALVPLPQTHLRLIQAVMAAVADAGRAGDLNLSECIKDEEIASRIREGLRLKPGGAA